MTNDTLLALSLLVSPQTITAALDLVETRAGGHFWDVFDELSLHSFDLSSHALEKCMGSDHSPHRHWEFPNVPDQPHLAQL